MAVFKHKCRWRNIQLRDRSWVERCTICGTKRPLKTTRAPRR